MKQSIADKLKLESNFCIKRLIRLCKDNCTYILIDGVAHSFEFNDGSILNIDNNNVIEINNQFVKPISIVEFTKELTNGVDTFNILAKQK